jgi:hypothetical protein
MSNEFPVLPHWETQLVENSDKWGILKDIPMDIVVDEYVAPEAKKTVIKSAWTLDMSIFSKRKDEAETKGFWDTQKIRNKSLDDDWKRYSSFPRHLLSLSLSLPPPPPPSSLPPFFL